MNRKRVEEAIRGALEALDPRRLAGRVYIERAPTAKMRLDVLRRWARGDGSPSADQVRTLVEELRSRAHGLQGIAGKLEEALREPDDTPDAEAQTRANEAFPPRPEDQLPGGSAETRGRGWWK